MGPTSLKNVLTVRSFRQEFYKYITELCRYSKMTRMYPNKLRSIHINEFFVWWQHKNY